MVKRDGESEGGGEGASPPARTGQGQREEKMVDRGNRGMGMGNGGGPEGCEPGAL